MHSRPGGPGREQPSDASGAPNDVSTAELRTRGYPDPTAAVNLRDAITFRAVDEAGRPALVISDGVTSVVLESGPAGVSFGLVLAAHHLAEALDDFAASTTAGWQAAAAGDADPRGRHRRIRIPSLRRGPGNRRDT